MVTSYRVPSGFTEALSLGPWFYQTHEASIVTKATMCVHTLPERIGKHFFSNFPFQGFNISIFLGNPYRERPLHQIISQETVCFYCLYGNYVQNNWMKMQLDADTIGLPTTQKNPWPKMSVNKCSVNWQVSRYSHMILIYRIDKNSNSRKTVDKNTTGPKTTGRAVSKLVGLH